MDELIRSEEIKTLLENRSRREILASVREIINKIRQSILDGGIKSPEIELSSSHIAKLVEEDLAKHSSKNLVPVINATGVIIHTNLGRAPLPEAAIEAIEETSKGYSNLEYDLKAGDRGSRQSVVEGLLKELTRAEAALVVNNNAAAVLVATRAIASGLEVIISRGEEVEIGASFRIPDVIRAAGAKMVEVGTTNKTHLYDYENAIGPDTAMIMKVHRSNFYIDGFTSEVALAKLVKLGRANSIPVMEDMGSGCMIDFARHGLGKEPMVKDSLESGADILTMSGDKLLGGPQAGIILGRERLVGAMKRDPIHRAVRIDKLSLAALEATLRLYLDERENEIPVVSMILAQEDDLKKRAQNIMRNLKKELADTGKNISLKLEPDYSKIGGGSFAREKLKTWTIRIEFEDGHGADSLLEVLRTSDPPVIARVKEGRIVLDVRTVLPGQEKPLVDALAKSLQKLKS